MSDEELKAELERLRTIVAKRTNKKKVPAYTASLADI
jgi:hypothetical protein